jgi:hypothetical protein
MACLLVMAATTMGCERPSPNDDEGAILTGVALAGPTCPVVRDPPDPACEDRPVVGAEIVVLDARGEEVTRLRTDAAGAFAVTLRAGEYQVVPQAVEGLLGTPGPAAVVVLAGTDPEPLTFFYDTGIR